MLHTVAEGRAPYEKAQRELQALVGAEVNRLEQEAYLLLQKVDVIRGFSVAKMTCQELIKVAGSKIALLIVHKAALRNGDADISRFNTRTRISWWASTLTQTGLRIFLRNQWRFSMLYLLALEQVALLPS